MSRTFGSQNVTTNYEVQVRKPFDARMLVSSYDALLTKENWVKSGTTQVIAYNGMLVAVADTTDAFRNGLYFLFDANCKTALKSPDVTNADNWIKIGETADISEFAERVTKIESELDNIKDRLDALEAEGSDVETYGYRSGFPATGEANKLYVAADEGKTYIWFQDEYMSVGGGSEQPEVIFGGTAD